MFISDHRSMASGRKGALSRLVSGIPAPVDNDAFGGKADKTEQIATGEIAIDTRSMAVIGTAAWEFDQFFATTVFCSSRQHAAVELGRGLGPNAALKLREPQ